MPFGYTIETIKEQAASILRGRKMLNRDQAWNVIRWKRGAPYYQAMNAISMLTGDMGTLPENTVPYEDIGSFISNSQRKKSQLLYYLKSEFNYADLSNATERKMCCDWLEIDQGDEKTARKLRATLKWLSKRTTPNDLQEVMAREFCKYMSRKPDSTYVREDGTYRMTFRNLNQMQAAMLHQTAVDSGCLASEIDGSFLYSVEVIIPERDSLEK